MILCVKLFFLRFAINWLIEIKKLVKISVIRGKKIELRTAFKY